MSKYSLEEEIGRQISEGIDDARRSGVICVKPKFFIIEKNIDGRLVRKTHVVKGR